MNSSERTLSIDPKTGTGTRTGTKIGTEIGIGIGSGTGNGNGNGNGSGSGNEFNSPENDDPNQLTFSLDLHSPFPFHKTPSWNTGIARSVEPIRSFDLHRSVDSINSDSYFSLPANRLDVDYEETRHLPSCLHAPLPPFLTQQCNTK